MCTLRSRILGPLENKNSDGDILYAEAHEAMDELAKA